MCTTCIAAEGRQARQARQAGVGTRKVGNRACDRVGHQLFRKWVSRCFNVFRTCSENGVQKITINVLL